MEVESEDDDGIDSAHRLTLLQKSVNGHQVLAISFDERTRWYVSSRRLLVTWA